MQPMASQRKHANPFSTLTIFISQRMFMIQWLVYWVREAIIFMKDAFYIVWFQICNDSVPLDIVWGIGMRDQKQWTMQWMASFSEKVDLTILPFFLPTYFQPNPSKLSPTSHRTKNRSILANNWYVREVSMAATGPDMTFLFVYFGVKHTVFKSIHRATRYLKRADKWS